MNQLLAVDSAGRDDLLAAELDVTEPPRFFTRSQDAGQSMILVGSVGSS
ncbi:MAG: hypothetical protein H6716_11415 [Polyangiaceae bacterium]|nr:hypothetical protein [Polyangiaceae bacterium]